MIIAEFPYVSDFLKDSIVNNRFKALHTSSSENATNWIANNLAFTDLPRQIDLFKNKMNELNGWNLWISTNSISTLTSTSTFYLMTQ